jgi:hypothetical protein
MRTLLPILYLVFCLASPAQAALSVQAEEALKQFLDHAARSNQPIEPPKFNHDHSTQN